MFCRTGENNNNNHFGRPSYLGCPTNHYVILFQPCKTYIKEMRPANQQNNTVFYFGNFNIFVFKFSSISIKSLQQLTPNLTAACNLCIWIQDFERLYFDRILYPILWDLQIHCMYWEQNWWNCTLCSSCRLKFNTHGLHVRKKAINTTHILSTYLLYYFRVSLLSFSCAKNI